MGVGGCADPGREAGMNNGKARGPGETHCGVGALRAGAAVPGRLDKGRAGSPPRLHPSGQPDRPQVPGANLR